MSDASRKHEIRCPIHGFINFNDWEKAVIDSPEFQRLRRIRQLAFTEFIYPGATHTRFEHSLGVMHVATRMYEALTQRYGDDFIKTFSYDKGGFDRDCQLLRFAALLHDVGHGPLSHASEDLMPFKAPGQRYKHEQYSAAIVRSKLRATIDQHPLSENSNLKADEIADFLEGKSTSKRRVFWRELLDGQMDADRADYLLRDSHHAGVAYGHYDLDRIIATLAVVPDEGNGLRVGVRKGGWHAAESLVIARYMMFTQVYFHQTRVAFNFLLRNILKAILPGGLFPSPEGAGLDQYLQWDDWSVLGAVAGGCAGEAGRQLRERDHPRNVYQTNEVTTQDDIKKLDAIQSALGERVVAVESAGKSWYKIGTSDIPVAMPDGVQPLSDLSSIVKNMRETNQQLVFVRSQDANEARAIVERMK